jgi:anti-anti-sigma factor
VSGELDRATSPLFERTLAEAQSRAGAVSVDLRDLDFIDSTGVALL